ncbi:hypothetical protein [Caulobacter phage Cr30]|uniref:nucleotidyltransferase n=1 Tax=Caulobacter phage Cr30 TaxID=1357714 RepID=UPI0004A9B638|nr:nucleotidyltransferase [Caulobacter phage Cr30]AGS80993.1 hypothetical protein [Caulobacter phage Cr30]
MRKLVELKFGSQLYGTATPNSDTDIKAVHIPDANEILLGCTARAIKNVTKEDNRQKNTAEDTDYESLSLHHYFKLLAEGQPMAIEVLDAPDEMLLYKDPLWDYIREHRDKYLSKNIIPYLGYCKQQANKYGIKGSRVAAVRYTLNWFKEQEKKYSSNAKLKELEWETFGFVEHTEIEKIPLANGDIIWHISCCGRKVPFGTKVKEAINVYQKLFDEYGQRALQAENNENIDWKAMSHAVRVGRQAIEYFSGNKLQFPLLYAQELLEIKLGKRDFKEISVMIDDLLIEVEKAGKASSLPEQPDHQFIEAMLLDIYRKEVCGC